MILFLCGCLGGPRGPPPPPPSRPGDKRLSFDAEDDENDGLRQLARTSPESTTNETRQGLLESACKVPVAVRPTDIQVEKMQDEETIGRYPSVLSPTVPASQDLVVPGTSVRALLASSDLMSPRPACFAVSAASARKATDDWLSAADGVVSSKSLSAVSAATTRSAITYLNPGQLKADVGDLVYIGQGATGLVYRGTLTCVAQPGDAGTDFAAGAVSVAVKFMICNTPQQLWHRAKEALLSKLVSHPNLVRTLAMDVTLITPNTFGEWNDKRRPSVDAVGFTTATTCSDAVSFGARSASMFNGPCSAAGVASTYGSMPAIGGVPSVLYHAAPHSTSTPPGSQAPQRPVLPASLIPLDTLPRPQLPDARSHSTQPLVVGSRHSPSETATARCGPLSDSAHAPAASLQPCVVRPQIERLRAETPPAQAAAARLRPGQEAERTLTPVLTAVEIGACPSLAAAGTPVARDEAQGPAEARGLWPGGFGASTRNVSQSNTQGSHPTSEGLWSKQEDCGGGIAVEDGGSSSMGDSGSNLRVEGRAAAGRVLHLQLSPVGLLEGELVETEGSRQGCSLTAACDGDSRGAQSVLLLGPHSQHQYPNPLVPPQQLQPLQRRSSSGTAAGALVGEQAAAAVLRTVAVTAAARVQPDAPSAASRGSVRLLPATEGAAHPPEPTWAGVPAAANSSARTVAGNTSGLAEVPTAAPLPAQPAPAWATSPAGCGEPRAFGGCRPGVLAPYIDLAGGAAPLLPSPPRLAQVCQNAGSGDGSQVSLGCTRSFAPGGGGGGGSGGGKVCTCPGSAVGASETVPFQDVLYHLDAMPGRFLAKVIMEYCDGGTLLQRINAGDYVAHPDKCPLAMLSAMRALLWCLQEIAAGMAHLHSLNIIHGDLKPSNVLLTSAASSPLGYVCKVSDFGLATALEASEQTITHENWGTVVYMAPESCAGRCRKASDVYSFGVLLWQMCTGQRPYAGLQAGQVLLGVKTGTLKLQWPPWANKSLVKVGQACLRFEPKERPGFKGIRSALAKVSARLDQKIAMVEAAGMPDAQLLQLSTTESAAQQPLAATATGEVAVGDEMVEGDGSSRGGAAGGAGGGDSGGGGGAAGEPAVVASAGVN